MSIQLRRTSKGPLRDVVDHELLLDCVHCGLCLEASPTYVITRAEWIRRAAAST